ncbi:hypothetical protein [Croceicoccus mobilis]|nr:hypothetical protein [Croceicoccus mobilis]
MQEFIGKISFFSFDRRTIDIAVRSEKFRPIRSGQKMRARMKQMHAEAHGHALNDNHGNGDIADWLASVKSPANGNNRGFRRTIDALMNG